MNCRESKSQLQTYLDGELDLIRNLEQEEHLRECSECSQAFGLKTCERLRWARLQNLSQCRL